MVQVEVLIFFCCTFSIVSGQVCRDCRIATVQIGERLKSADCHRKELIKVPRCHTSGIEVLDLSSNRLREIEKDDLDSYPNVQILYLSDNFLREIDDDAFSDKYYLGILDLSSNALYRLPSAIFRLPRLWKLNLANIANPDMADHIESALPITSPLTQLNLSKNKLTKLPNLGEMPGLAYINVSGNKNVHLNVSNFAGLCSLKTFENEDFSAVFEDPCDCQMLNEWLVRREVDFSNFTCEKIACNGSLPEAYLKTYNHCKKTYDEQQLRIFRQQILTNTGIGVAVVAILIVILVMILLRSKKNKKRKLQEQDEKGREYYD